MPKETAEALELAEKTSATSGAAAAAAAAVSRTMPRGCVVAFHGASFAKKG